jgi:hypothetical protein
VLQVTIPAFETEVTHANIYAGTTATNLTLQGAILQDGASWTEPVSGMTTTGAVPPTANTAFGSVLDLYQHTMGIDGSANLSPSAHVSYLFRDIDSLIQSVPGTSTYVAGDPEKYEEGLIWAHNNFWPPTVAPSFGDVDGDGRVTPADLRLLVRMLLGQVTPDVGKADLSGDGKVSLADVRVLVGLLGE